MTPLQYKVLSTDSHSANPWQKMAQSPLNGTTQTVDTEEEGFTSNHWQTKRKNRVSGLHAPGAISSRLWWSISKVSPWSSTLCQPVLSESGRKTAQSPLSGATQTVDIGGGGGSFTSRHSESPPRRSSGCKPYPLPLSYPTISLNLLFQDLVRSKLGFIFGCLNDRNHSFHSYLHTQN